MSRKKHKVDLAETAAREFKDKRSYVTLFGKEYVFGRDMEARRRQVYEIYNGTCRECFRRFDWEYEGWDMDHIVSRGKGGADNLTNLQILCRTCHGKKHVRPMFSKHEFPRPAVTSSSGRTDQPEPLRVGRGKGV